MHAFAYIRHFFPGETEKRDCFYTQVHYPNEEFDAYEAI